jgi:hypothetical protein
VPEPRAAGIEDVEAIGIRMTERVIAEVTAGLNAKVDQAFAEVHATLTDVRATLIDVQATLAEHDGRLTGQGQRLDELAATVRVAAATVTKMVADLAEQQPHPPRPGAALPRPKALDDACAAAAEDDRPQSIQVEVHGRTVTQYVAPGTDPAQVWDDLCATISDRARAVAWHN